jgi:hypothetical protein
MGIGSFEEGLDRRSQLMAACKLARQSVQLNTQDGRISSPSGRAGTGRV